MIRKVTLISFAALSIICFLLSIHWVEMDKLGQIKELEPQLQQQRQRLEACFIWGYPQYYAGIYIGSDYHYHVMFTDHATADDIAWFRETAGEPEIVIESGLTYSYLELIERRKAIIKQLNESISTQIRYRCFLSVTIDQMKNQICIEWVANEGDETISIELNRWMDENQLDTDLIRINRLSPGSIPENVGPGM